MTKKTVTTPPIQDDSGAELDILKSEIINLKSSLARALADYSNLEKRFERDSSSIVKFANSNILEKLLEVRDHLGMAAAAGLPAQAGDTSLKLILSTFDKVLVAEGVTEVKTTGNFDPAHMECQDTVAGEKDKVISVIRPGYLLHDRVLRPARVTVGNGEKPTSSN